MKYLFITEYFPSSSTLTLHGGVEMRVYAIAARLAKKHTVHIITSRLENQSSFQIFSKIKVFRVGRARKYTRKGVWDRLLFMISAIQMSLRVDFDVVEGSSFFGWLPAWIVGVLKHKPRSILVADIISEYANDAGIWKIPLAFAERWLLKRKWSVVLCISQTVVEKVKPFLSSSIFPHMIYCGVDLQKLRKVKAKKSSQPTIICVARLVPYKRVQDLVCATKLMKQKIYVKIVGDGDYREELERLIKENNLQSRIYLHGFVSDYNDVLKLIKGSYIFCLPSIVEGFGIVTIEALALGIPAVVADIPIQREITNDVGVLYFKPKNPIDLAQKLDTLIQDKKLYQSLIHKSQTKLSLYDWNKLTEQTEEVYANLHIN